MKRQKRELWAGIVFSLIGVCMLTLSFFLGKDALRFSLNSYRVNATVLSVQTMTGRDSKGHQSTRYAPKVRFSTKTGQTIEAQSSCYSKHHYGAGESLALLVENDNPYAFKTSGGGVGMGLFSRQPFDRDWMHLAVHCDGYSCHQKQKKYRQQKIRQTC